MNISFRDPDGKVIVKENRVLRLVRPDMQPNPVDFVNSKIFTQLVAEQLLVPTTFHGEASAQKILGEENGSTFEDPALLFEHEKLFFVSYPYEWANEMLEAAGNLTLDIAERILAAGLGLKDATPYNVLFRGPHPIFVDLLSFEQRDARDQTWRGYAQFLRTFVRPLLVRRFGLGLSDILITHRDGLNAADVAQLCSTTQKLRPPFLSLVTLPSLLGRTNRANDSSIYEQHLTSSPEKASYILSRQFKSLRKALRRAGAATPSKSAWSSYADEPHHSQNYLEAKRDFVRRALIEGNTAEAVLDVGCNTGDFSEIAASCGARVVAIDRDSVVVGKLWKRAVDKELDVLPLVVDWTRPTPAIGWRNTECSSFLERAGGKFDCLLMLAVLHHILVTERIPLDETLSLASELTADRLLIEFIPPSDPRFRQITRGNDNLYQSLTQRSFENVAEKYFRIEQSAELPDSQRRLYMMRRAR